MPELIVRFQDTIQGYEAPVEFKELNRTIKKLLKDLFRPINNSPVSSTGQHKLFDWIVRPVMIELQKHHIATVRHRVGRMGDALVEVLRVADVDSGRKHSRRPPILRSESAPSEDPEVSLGSS